MLLRFIVALFALFVALAPSVYALPVGGPAAPLRPQQFSGQAGVGYTHRQVAGDHFGRDKFDSQSSFRFLLRGEYAVTRWFTPIVTLGLNDRSRRLTDFEGRLGALFGVGARFDIVQDVPSEFSLSLIGQVSYENSEGTGRYRIKDSITGEFSESKANDERADSARVWHSEATLLFAKRSGFITFYGGPKLDYDWTYYRTRKEEVRPFYPFGLAIGVDYQVTDRSPDVFFTLEMENFSQDAIYAMVGGRF